MKNANQKELLNLNHSNFTEKDSLNNSTAAKKIILYQSKTYFYKTYKDIAQAYYEIVTYKIAEKLKMKTAKYQRVTLNQENGTISENFNPQDKEIISLYEILDLMKQRKNISCTTNSLNNLSSIWQAIYDYTKDKSITSKIMDEIKDIFILQILVGDIDRRPKNILFFKSPILQTTPNFDYNGAFTIDLKENFFIPYGLGTTYNGTQFFDVYQTINEFITIESDSQRLEKNCILTEKYLPIILYEIETEYQSSIPLEIKKHIINTIKNNISILMELLNEKRKGQSR